jgi:glycosyltransferase involved in cell wall biosynthesis
MGVKMSIVRTAGVIATYNHELFVKESVLSLAEQVDELIVVDDYSSDKTQDIIRGLSIPNMKVVLHRKNMGVSSSYNEAIHLAEADVIVIQGGDDRSLPGRVAKHLRHFKSPSTVISFGRPLIINSTGDSLPDDAAPEFFQEIQLEKVLDHLYFFGNFVCAPSVAFRKSIFQKLGGFNPAIAFLQDYDLWLKFAGIGSFVQSDQPLVEYRKHANNLSRDSVSKSITYLGRFEAELDYVLGSSATTFSRSALKSLAVRLGLSGAQFDQTDSKLLLALIQLGHGNITQVRRGLSSLLGIIGSRGDMDFLEAYGIDSAKLDDYARFCDHKNSSSNSRINFRHGKLVH